jgi:hypothetical protein
VGSSSPCFKSELAGSISRGPRVYSPAIHWAIHWEETEGGDASRFITDSSSGSHPTDSRGVPLPQEEEAETETAMASSRAARSLRHRTRAAEATPLAWRHATWTSGCASVEMSEQSVTAERARERASSRAAKWCGRVKTTRSNAATATASSSVSVSAAGAFFTPRTWRKRHEGRDSDSETTGPIGLDGQMELVQMTANDDNRRNLQ